MTGRDVNSGSLGRVHHTILNLSVADDNFFCHYLVIEFIDFCDGQWKVFKSILMSLRILFSVMIFCYEILVLIFLTLGIKKY